jgi:hypothetical protein
MWYGVELTVSSIAAMVFTFWAMSILSRIGQVSNQMLLASVRPIVILEALAAVAGLILAISGAKTAK